ncbi:pathogenesis-related protein PR-1-like [Macadamia integrifolia]|uniref:pathogenesis-related protein PR-1-like n=1 Tax=Macadamia integrifolia TaxID=60698 RepID=UPI001C4FD180|nr:pathogenesis-related protein PR-1-like [Macadamia integrifolia]
MIYLRCHAAIVMLFLLFLFGCSHGNNNTTWSQSKKSRKANLATQFLTRHNAARAALHLPRMVWDKEVAKYAQWYANQRRWDCALKHSNGPYGENIFWGSGYEWTAAQAVGAWLSEKKWYNYHSNSCSEGEECGHYTQIVWRSSRKLGCAKVTCFHGRGVFITCNYDPPGNYIGDRPY